MSESEPDMSPEIRALRKKVAENGDLTSAVACMLDQILDDGWGVIVTDMGTILSVDFRGNPDASNP